MGLAHWARGNLGHALECYTECLQIFRVIDNRNGEASALIRLAEVNCELGRYREAEIRANLGVTLGRRSGERRHEAGGLGVLAAVHQRMGDHTTAEALCREALRLSRETGFRYGEISVLIGLSTVRLDTGKPLEALQICEDALTITFGSGAHVLEPRVHDGLARARLGLQDFCEAGSCATRAFAIARRRDQRLDEARAQFTLGLVRDSLADGAGAKPIGRRRWRSFPTSARPKRGKCARCSTPKSHSRVVAC